MPIDVEERYRWTQAGAGSHGRFASFSFFECPRANHSFIPVEAAEEKLVNATEEAINLMRQVLENVRPLLSPSLVPPDSFPLSQPEPIKNLAALVKAQQAFYAQAAEALAAVQGELDEAGVQAEADYRKSRAQ